MNKSQSKITGQAISDIEGIMAGLETVIEELQETYDGKSEKWQEGEKGEELVARIDQLRCAVDSLLAASEEIDNARGSSGY